MLTPKPISTVLSPATLTGLVSSFMGGQPDKRPLTALFRAGRPLTSDFAESTGDTIATWDQVTGRRHLAGFVGSSAPSQEVAREGVETKTSACAHIKLHKRLPGSILINERAPGMATASQQAVINQALTDLGNMIADTIERACALVLSTGKFTASKANFPETQLIFDLDFGATSNQAFARSAAWSNVGTKIISNDVPLLIKKAFQDASGETAGRVVYGPSVEASILKNTEFQALSAAQAGLSIIQGAGMGASVKQFRIGGMDWEPTTGTFKPTGGAVTPFFPADTIAVLPQGLGDTLGMAFGREVIPASQVFAPSAQGGASLLTLSPEGVYSYAELQGNGVILHAGIVFLPVLMNAGNLMRGAA
jgi:hypothetical protein